MRLFFGILIGLLLAVGVAVGAGYYAFGGMADVGERDKSNDVTQTIEAADFDRIDIAGVYEIDVTVGGDYSVVVSGAQSEMDQLKVYVANGELVLDQEKIQKRKRRWRDMGLTAEITLPALSSVEIAGVADADIRGVDSDEFRVDLAGVGDFKISGRCGRVVAELSGIGDLDASDLECREAEVDVSGIGEAQVYASEKADASVNGIGSIVIHGSPQNVSKSTSFISSITVK